MPGYSSSSEARAAVRRRHVRQRSRERSLGTVGHMVTAGLTRAPQHLPLPARGLVLDADDLQRDPGRVAVLNSRQPPDAEPQGALVGSPSAARSCPAAAGSITGQASCVRPGAGQTTSRECSNGAAPTSAGTCPSNEDTDFGEATIRRARLARRNVLVRPESVGPRWVPHRVLRSEGAAGPRS